MGEVSYPHSRPRTRPLLLRDPVPTSPPRNPIRATWDIEIGTRDGSTVALRRAGSRLEVNGEAVVDEPSAEYAGIYARFAELLRTGHSEVDAAPLRLTADAFLLARRITLEAFSP